MIYPERNYLTWFWLAASILPLALASMIFISEFKKLGFDSPLTIWVSFEFLSVAIPVAYLRRKRVEQRVLPAGKLTLNVDSRGRWQFSLSDLISVVLFAALAMFLAKFISAGFDDPKRFMFVAGIPIALSCVVGYTFALLLLSRDGYCYEGMDKWMWALGALLAWVATIIFMGIFKLFVECMILLCLGVR